MKSFVNDLIVTCHEIENTPKSAVYSPSNGINYWFIAVFLLTTIACLLLLVAVIFKYYMKCE